MPDNKLVIRRLPPTMTEDDFLKQISPLSEHDYFCFFEANSGLGLHSFSRAYINFLDSSDMAVFKERFDNYVFLDKDGHEYPAVVEQALWHKSAKSGPFYKISAPGTSDENGQNKNSVVSSSDNNDDPKEQTHNKGIEDDPDYVEFIEMYKSQKKKPQQSSIQTLEANLDELTKQDPKSTSASATNNNSKDVKYKSVTPLIGYVNQQRSLKVTNKRGDKGK